MKRTSIIVGVALEVFLIGAARAAGESDAQVLFSAQCSACHTIGQGDRVGPDLKGIASHETKEWLMGYLSDSGKYLDTDPHAKELLKKYHGVRMPNLGLNKEQVESLLVYLASAGGGMAGFASPSAHEASSEMEQGGVSGSTAPAAAAPPLGSQAQPLASSSALGGLEPSWTGLGLLVILGFLGSTLWIKGAYRSSSIVLVLLAGAVYWVSGGEQNYQIWGDQEGYAPEQPIAFSHALHAGKYGISCLYCHHGAAKSDVAGVPSVNVCMNCHKVIGQDPDAGKVSSEIAKLAAVWNGRGGKNPHSMEWARIHQLPAYVHFSHRAHIANNISCQTCHGSVESMDRTRQFAPLSMGWCVQCHRLNKDHAPAAWKRAGGPVDCAACHW